MGRSHHRLHDAARGAHTATLFASGKVLVAGGASTAGNALSSVELYDPTTGTFSATGSMGRTTLLSHGKRARFGQDPGRRGSRRWQQHQQPSRECGTLRPGQRNVLGHGLDGDSARRAHGGCAPVGQGASSGRIRRKRRARERGAVRSARRWRELHRGWRMSIVRVQRRYLLRGRMRRCVHDLRGRYWRMHDCDPC